MFYLVPFFLNFYKYCTCSGTLRENLDPFENFDDEKLWRALDQAHLKGAVSDFEKKLDHEVAENGSNLR